MKLEFIPDYPLIRLYAFTCEDVMRLHAKVTQLADGRADSAEVHAIPKVESVGGCLLTLKNGPKDRGVAPVSQPADLECVLRQHMWEQVAGLIEPFCRSAQLDHYQWLDKTSEISLLLSVTGTW
jgi:hypothetical protein